MIDLNKLAAEIHDAAVKKGFWDVEHAEDKHLAKMISELGEVVQADRAGVMYEIEHEGAKPEGVVAELADFIMMAIDMYAHYECDFDQIADMIADREGLKELMSETPVYMLALAMCADTMTFARDEGDDKLARAMHTAIMWIEVQGFDPEEVIREKMEYNASGRGYLHGRLY